MMADQQSLDDLTYRFMVRNAHVVRKMLLVTALNSHLAKSNQTLLHTNTTDNDLRYNLELSQLYYLSRSKPHAKLSRLLVTLHNNPQLIHHFSSQIQQLFRLGSCHEVLGR